MFPNGSGAEGFKINGVSMKLQGGCVHHDNGPLGSKTIDRAEERRVESLKAAGHRSHEITSEINGPGEGITAYYFAEDYHQQYLAKPGARPYCSAQPTGVPVDPEWLKENGAKLGAGYWAKYGPRPGCTIQVSDEPVSLEDALSA